MRLVHKNSEILTRPAKRVGCKQGREQGRRLLAFLRSINNQKLSSRRAIGIAAPQVGLDAAVCAVSFPANNEFILVNPEIIFFDTTTVEDIEHCLSLPGEAYIIERSVRIQVKADNFDKVLHFGPKFGEIWTPDELLESRCIQHEIHHTQGILISHIGKQLKF
jgi:peptide deformylase